MSKSAARQGRIAGYLLLVLGVGGLGGAVLAAIHGDQNYIGQMFFFALFGGGMLYGGLMWFTSLRTAALKREVLLLERAQQRQQKQDQYDRDAAEYRRRHLRRQQRTMNASAIITEVRRVGSWGDGDPMDGPIVSFRLLLRLAGDAGEREIWATEIWILSENIVRLQVGTVLSARYDPRDDSNVAVDFGKGEAVRTSSSAGIWTIDPLPPDHPSMGAIAPL